MLALMLIVGGCGAEDRPDVAAEECLPDFIEGDFTRVEMLVPEQTRGMGLNAFGEERPGR